MHSGLQENCAMNQNDFPRNFLSVCVIIFERRGAASKGLWDPEDTSMWEVSYVDAPSKNAPCMC